jgi:hypothetical protein
LSLFEFELAPVEAIEPWGTPPDLALHWFGLSDGSYHLEIGDARLLEYAPRDNWPHFVEYQLARLHEDVLSMLPAVLEPIPSTVTLSLRDGSLDSTRRHVWKASESLDGADASLDVALDAFGSRMLDTLYLKPGAGIWIWSHGSKTVIEWDNRDRLLDGQQVWTATHGRHELARDEFVDEVRSFDRRLMAAMGERVRRARAGWARPDVKLDIERLVAEQAERSGSLQSVLAGGHHTTDWHAVAAALSRIGSGGVE